AYPHQLSGGMKQRAAIARALANRPRMLLMDEPFGAHDAQTRCQMQSYLLQIWRQVDITILFITHDLDEAVYLADRILILDAHPGRVREVMEVAVPRPRSAEQFLSPAFIAARHNLADTLKAQFTAFLTAGRVLYSDMGRVLASVVADDCGWHDTISGLGDAAANVARFGAGSYQTLRNEWHRNGRDNLLVELGK